MTIRYAIVQSLILIVVALACVPLVTYATSSWTVRDFWCYFAGTMVFSLQVAASQLLAGLWISLGMKNKTTSEDESGWAL